MTESALEISDDESSLGQVASISKAVQSASKFRRGDLIFTDEVADIFVVRFAQIEFIALAPKGDCSLMSAYRDRVTGMTVFIPNPIHSFGRRVRFEVRHFIWNFETFSTLGLTCLLLGTVF